jgi:hypothetical protein
MNFYQMEGQDGDWWIISWGLQTGAFLKVSFWNSETTSYCCTYAPIDAKKWKILIRGESSIMSYSPSEQNDIYYTADDVDTLSLTDSPQLQMIQIVVILYCLHPKILKQYTSSLHLGYLSDRASNSLNPPPLFLVIGMVRKSFGFWFGFWNCTFQNLAGAGQISSYVPVREDLFSKS